jgi:4-aminobutyrate aminotransferase-like enzyme
VRGWMQYLYDDTGRAFLDVYNNVPLVGHSHPRVVRAVRKQMLSSIQTRAMFTITSHPLRPAPNPASPGASTRLLLCKFRKRSQRTCASAGTHAHRPRRRYRPRTPYHGHTTTLIDISPYKFNGPGGRGRKPWVTWPPSPMTIAVPIAATILNPEQIRSARCGDLWRRRARRPKRGGVHR